MPGHQRPVNGSARPGQVTMALRLVWVSVVFGIGSGAMAVITGLANHSLSVLAAGLGVLADVTGSATPDWRFRAERRQPGRSQAAEARATIVVAAAPGRRLPPWHIGRDLGRGSGLAGGPDTLAYAQTASRRADGQPRLQGDGTLSGIGAVTSLLALTVLARYHTLRWWWADRAAALIVAAIAAAEAWHTALHQQPPT